MIVVDDYFTSSYDNYFGKPRDIYGTCNDPNHLYAKLGGKICISPFLSNF